MSTINSVRSTVTGKIRYKAQIGELYGMPIQVTLGFVIVHAYFTLMMALNPTFQELYLHTVDSLSPIGIYTLDSVSLVTSLFISFTIITLLYFSVFLHELGHAFASERYSYGTDSIKLWVLGGIAHLSKEPDHPRSEFVVAVAGPFVTVVIAAVSLGVGVLTAGVAPTSITTVFISLGFFNIFLLGLNLIPAYPLDGARLLKSILSIVVGTYERATLIGMKLGQFIALIGGIYAIVNIEIFLFIMCLVVFLISRGRESIMKTQQKILNYPSFSDSHETSPQLDTNRVVIGFGTLSETQWQKITHHWKQKGGRIACDVNDVDAVDKPENATEENEDILVRVYDDTNNPLEVHSSVEDENERISINTGRENEQGWITIGEFYNYT